MPYRYVVADVFTRHAYGGNPLAVVLDAQGLDTAQMQRIAREFNSPRPASCCRRAIRRTRPRCGSSRPIGKCLSPDIPMSARRWCWRASWRRRDVPCRTRSCSKRRPGWCGSRCGAKGGREWRRVAGAAAAVPARPGARGCGGAGLAPGARGHRDGRARAASRVGRPDLPGGPAGQPRCAAPRVAGSCRLCGAAAAGRRAFHLCLYDRHSCGHGAGADRHPGPHVHGPHDGRPGRQRTAAATALRAALRARGPRCDCAWDGAWTWGAPACCTRMQRSGRTVWAGVAGNAVVVMEGTLAAPAAS